MGHYEHKGDGALSLLAGRGRAEYGASTMRSGSLTTNAIANGQLESYDVVFDTPMPDTDYLVEIETMRAYALISVDHRTESSSSPKTVNGFRIHVVAAGSNLDSFTIKWKAFKLYTDTEYNSVLDAVRDSGWQEATATTALASGKVYYRTIGSLCVVRGENIKISSSATVPTNLVEDVPTCKYQPSNNIFVRSTGLSSEGTVWINPLDTAIRTCIPSGLAGQAVSISLNYFID